LVDISIEMMVILVSGAHVSVFLHFRALDDIEESIKELEYYRKVIFKTCTWSLQLARTAATVL